MSEQLKLATSVPRDYLEVLGGLSVNFGALENALRISVWALRGGLSSDQAAERQQIVTAQLSFKQLVWLMGSVYRHRFPGRNESTIDSYTKRCFDTEQQRNTLIHSLWVGGDVKESATLALRLKLSARSEFKVHAEQHTIDQLVAIANQCTRLANELQSFIIGEVLTEEQPASAPTEST